MSTKVAEMAFQNQNVQNLARDSYDLTSLEAVRSLLARRQTMRLMRYASGGASAVTPLNFFCLDAAVDGLLVNHWDRDSIFQAIGELEAQLDPELGAGLRIKRNAWCRGLNASLLHHHRYQGRFLDIISGRKSGTDYAARPNIRYNPAGLFEIADLWGHAQNDALGAINFLQFYALNRGHLSWGKMANKPQFNSVPVLMHNYLWKVCVWVDWELGAWEDKRAEHASSIGVVLASLREQLDFMKAHGKKLLFQAENHTFELTESGVTDLIGKCEGTLKAVLPNEFIHSDKNEVRRADIALINALFLSAMSGRPLIDDAMTLAIIDNCERYLMGHIGFIRYEGDIWDGRINRPGVPAAQWCHAAPMLSYIFGELYRRTGKKEYFDKQVWYFNRTLAQVNSRWHLPEAYIIHPTTGLWVSDANESLAWAQAMAICAFAGMKCSLKKEAADKATGASASTTQDTAAVTPVATTPTSTNASDPTGS